MTRYLDLAEYLWLAGEATRIDPVRLSRIARIGLADSALHAPAAEFAGHEFYPGLIDKSAVLLCRLVWNHPLPDGNKRAAWIAASMFIELNGGRWEPAPPNVDEAEAVMFAVAAREVDEPWIAAWLGDRVRFS